MTPIPSKVFRFSVATAIAAATLLPTNASQLDAQTPPPVSARAGEGTLPRGVGRDVTDRWNAAETKRVRGPFTLSASDTLRSDLAVVDGPVKIAGVVTGHVVAINTSVEFESTGRVGGDLTVVGGEIRNRTPASVKGEAREWRERLRYTETGGRLEPITESADLARWQRWGRIREVQGAWGDIFAASAHTYNRVEGLPLLLGPRLRTRHGDTRATVEAYGIFRTGGDLSWEPANLGHRVRAEVRQGRTVGYAIGARLYDEVEPVERWALTDDEVGLASVLFTRDFRDYYQRHGGSGYATLFGPAQTSLNVSYARERWDSRSARNPWSLFQSRDTWRANPMVDEGLMNLFTLTGQLDTRNNFDRPRSGWLLKAEFEHGSGTLDRIAPTTFGTRATLPGNITYSRAMFDVRRYNRLAPNTQLNLRMIGGGVLAGDQLPAQRRFSVSGADALPGYDFRSKAGDTDVGSCSSGSDSLYAALGRPAQCDRFAVFQAEWKTDFRFSIFSDREAGGHWPFNRRFRAEGAWVLFMNTGRGWLIGEGDDLLHYAKSNLPTLRSWRTDVGGGLDFGSFGVYIAQSVTDTDLKPNVFIRLGRRF